MYAIVDIETTGSHAAANGITEVAIFIHDGTRVIDHYETLINPRQEIPYFIQTMTGITNEMVADAPAFDEVAEEIYEMLKDKIFIAHNVNFDYSFLKHQLQECGYQLDAKKLCTVRLTRKVFTDLPSYSLGNICRSLQIEIENRHRAGGDAWATVRLFEMLLKNNAAPHILQFLKKSSREQYLPLHLPKEHIEQLPRTPGVYYFRNQKGKVIYVGKAKNLRSRVSSHFTHNGAGRQKQEFIRNVYHISYQVCGTELMAAILEETEIKRWWPKYNTSRKQISFQYGLYVFEDQKGYARLAIERKRKYLRPVHTFGLMWDGYRLLWNMIERHQLSPRLCFIDKSKEMGEVAEVNDEPEVYNKRVEQALTTLYEELPTFAVVGAGVEPGQQSCLLIEKGKFFGMGYIPEAMKPDLKKIKKILTPYHDNDFIRDMIYRYAETFPQRRITFN
ncbi:MAG: exonuclease domain-containing protein [Agriterribacter sp.]